MAHSVQREMQQNLGDKKPGDTFCKTPSSTGQNHLQHITLQLLHHYEYLQTRQPNTADIRRCYNHYCCLADQFW